MHSLNQKFLAELSFNSEQLTILRMLGEYQGKQKLYCRQSPEILKGLQQVAIIESNESSNRLEGIVAPYHRITDLVVHNSPPKDRSEQEIAGYRDALQLIHQSAFHMPINLNIILQLHSWLYRYQTETGGVWKICDNLITEVYPDGQKRIRFTPSTAFETPRAMEQLVGKYKLSLQEWSVEPLIVIPLAILDFLCIHPFKDGNGRTARLLTLLMLYHYDYQVGRYISLERIFEESKESYYETLEKSSQGWHYGKHQVMPWLTYFWGVLLRAYKEFEQRVGTIHNGKGNKALYIRQTIENMIGAFAISDIERACPSISRDTIRLVLRQLRDEQIIVPVGKGRNAKWMREG